MSIDKNLKKGLFIVFEGLDGSGKSTQIKLLKEKLLKTGVSVHCTAEPTSSATGGLIRDALAGECKRVPSELAALFLADRIAHNMNSNYGIKKLLEEGTHVICDRYYYSSFAYQGFETDLDWVMSINLDCPEILKPDICLFLDVDSAECKKRIDKDRTHLEIFEENIETLSKIRYKFYEVFKKLERRENIKIIDASRSPDIISDEILGIVMESFWPSE